MFLPRAEFDFVFEEFFEDFRPVAVIFRIRLERGSFKGTLERGEGIARVTKITKTFAFVLLARARGDFRNSFRDWREHELLLLPLLILRRAIAEGNFRDVFSGQLMSPPPLLFQQHGLVFVRRTTSFKRFLKVRVVRNLLTRRSASRVEREHARE